MTWTSLLSRKALVVLLILIVAGALFLWKRGGSQATAYQEVTVARGDIEENVLSTGIVQPENRLAIKPPIGGRVEKVLVDEGEKVKKGQVLILISSTERAAVLDAARARGGEELKRWEGYYRPAPILAPIDGTIILRAAEPGQTFTTADAPLVMSDRLTVKAQVDETDIAKIRLKEKAEIVLDAYPGETIPAVVDQIAYDATTVNNVTTYIVDVLPDETPPNMRSGMTANVTFSVASKQNVLVLPANAVKNKEGKQLVLVPSKESFGKPEEKPVEVGISDGKRVEIVSGLAEGDVVLVVSMKKVSGAAEQTNPFSPFAPRRR
jgi:membrane fusion protein, macrolide-specific efflux system